MKLKFAIGTMILGAALSAGTSAGTYGRNPVTTGATTGAQEPDNTKNNKQEAQAGRTTADKQGETAGDRELAKKIRKSITDDDSLSTYAHNVKIIVRNGSVVLKGPVRSDDEKKAVGAKAEEIAGAGHVKNLLTVKA